ncbi:bifunctional diaminohydroxyphosphoribosylaminopyrimidine deaminase/5-amino-6-(5-phosphoribosylamino)uracil reductase RibD [Ensifer adhaerens]|uniref:bifunctional diaminohydroxyphosphoribosylaminopyrimidine deaminase/5-amino-6-(5-phosphoribosylamino)uracil reductase RibD n=1 Tax=Ensifer adhaerens TaxID=106592 RepID=UPI001CBE23D2|nr:bifunctional diaminohydroxyphosphoribosylaminopyrimidine deaminase/5-amino-6-(5-phosphoribosylamino)uracil reductase RibD [Ensifer adhaerens]MBZ7921100.1 bifunctional diaminohydroxyphosphoribosylaminopyrimidine deaminase/5-amino-6-(5-phosphoribosylamino)uracil reductase RibD [Ensifer adhaerens]UAX93543.1 bifunctional diaminohydroxyphosphoribosylaminopyrimidine deaminase/5-amino-6-(5-phosphoribosylamino)uracil reductase RibD [Ensifer adhaerens]UAY01179.1 bifunctional diaminohydroxyphosphoribos
MTAPNREDERFMAAALRLARHHLGQTSTNPSVACVIVKDGVIVGRAVTARSGRPHAETQALAEAGEEARGATAYVTLEPCSHHGKTPPCADALVASGVSRVVIAILDPDERVAGRGVVRLRDAGITVDIGVLAEDGQHALEAYLMRQVSRRPYVTLKLAVSADGMIGRKGEGQVRITGPISRGQVQTLRAETDAILVGIGTATADDPELTVRLPGLEHHSPLRIVLDRRLDLPLFSKLARTARDVPVIVVSSDESGDADTDDGRTARKAALEAAGVEVLEAGSIADLLAALASRGLSSLMVEGGAVAARAFLDAGLVDRIQLYTGPGTIGENGIASPFDRRSVPTGYRRIAEARYGDDLFEEYERES